MIFTEKVVFLLHLGAGLSRCHAIYLKFVSYPLEGMGGNLKLRANWIMGPQILPRPLVLRLGEGRNEPPCGPDAGLPRAGLCCHNLHTIFRVPFHLWQLLLHFYYQQSSSFLPKCQERQEGVQSSGCCPILRNPQWAPFLWLQDPHPDLRA